MAQLDEAFIQSIEHRRKSTTHDAEFIPVIDLSALKSNHRNEIADLAAEVGRAWEEWGFFQVINHIVPSTIREEIEHAARLFFTLPAEEKRKVLRDESNPMGFYDTEHTKNVRDWKQVFDFTAEIPTVIPASIEPEDVELREVVNQWPNLDICVAVLSMMGMGYQDQTSFTRLNYYPRCPTPDLVLGVGCHKDSGALTILSQDDVGGLEVKRKRMENGFKSDPPQVLSNDKYKSIEHRVMVNPERERFSIPFFFNPTHSVMVAPIEELTSQQNPVRYRAFNWGKFHTTRNLSNFKKLSVEIFRFVISVYKMRVWCF
ncbi:hypothetical protein C2S51_022398 [Perilla frutescens var. frutescens]|nr:hypothetical protein C2S51_022398 [Perilla frutescens var. frutescens]